MLFSAGRKPRPHEYMSRLEDAADNPAFTKARVACQDPEPGVGGRFSIVAFAERYQLRG